MTRMVNSGTLIHVCWVTVALCHCCSCDKNCIGLHYCTYQITTNTNFPWFPINPINFLFSLKFHLTNLFPWLPVFPNLQEPTETNINPRILNLRTTNPYRNPVWLGFSHRQLMTWVFSGVFLWRVMSRGLCPRIRNISVSSHTHSAIVGRQLSISTAHESRTISAVSFGSSCLCWHLHRCRFARTSHCMSDDCPCNTSSKHVQVQKNVLRVYEWSLSFSLSLSLSSPFSIYWLNNNSSNCRRLRFSSK